MQHRCLQSRIGILQKWRWPCIWVFSVTLYSNVYGLLFAKEGFRSNFKHAVHAGVYGNVVAAYCAVQQIGIPPLACALHLLGEIGYILN